MKCKIIAEQTLLASVIYDNRRFVDARILIDPNAFSLDLHRIIYEAMIGLYDGHEFIDYINLSEKLLSTGQITAFTYLKYFHAWPVSEDISSLARSILNHG
ncbi:MAG TPA: DnaB-like helicase N-terminal domain-containing protein [Dissulfurispiraceae bacterium]|nr:DnaB-like helicase N-terminal domain-containing protein [Dissulfurispiraceae bacterium]